MVQRYHTRKEPHKNLNFHDKFDLKVKVTSFNLVQNLSMINKQFKCIQNIKQTYYMFEGQFDLECQGHQFLMNCLGWKVKF